MIISAALVASLVASHSLTRFVFVQPDVLEALVQAGADLHAKTKNGETVLEICEDPELKERIIQLKSEMETKRASHTNKLKRSHSSNTRSQSVRRTSIREKTQISRREAREEARLRHEKEHNGTAHDDDDAKSQLEQLTEVEQAPKQSTPNTLMPPVELDNVEILLEQNNKAQVSAADSTASNSQTSLCSKPQEHKEAVVIRNTGFCERDAATTPTNNGQTASPTSDTSPTNTSLPRGSSGESVKVEIHVTVNTTPTYGSSTGTLADLKKQRADMRRSVTTTSTDSPPGDDKPPSYNNSHLIRATYMLDAQPPPSPSNTLKKFRGDPSEVVGEIHKRGCCVIS